MTTSKNATTRNNTGDKACSSKSNVTQTGKSKKQTKPAASRRKAVVKPRPVAKKTAKKRALTRADTIEKKSSIKRRKRAALKPADIEEIFKRFSKINPKPKGELESVNDYTLLVAVVLSAQATDAGVNKATRSLFKVANTPEKMVKLGEDRLRDYIKSIGLFRNKAKNIIALSQKLVKDFGSKVPRDRDTLETLPGVGRKTANVVMNVAFGEPTMAVDTHVLRVSNRIGLSNGKTPLAVEKDLLEKIPKKYAVPAHHWLILHGRYLCKARKPQCWRCPINDLCQYDEKTKAP